MKEKPVVRRARARRDLEAASDFYVREAGTDVADRFLDAVRQSLVVIGRRPRTGSPRYGLELGIAGLRSRAVRRFPYLIFYVEYPGRIEVWRILHSQRDIARTLRD